MRLQSLALTQNRLANVSAVCCIHTFLRCSLESRKASLPPTLHLVHAGVQGASLGAAAGPAAALGAAGEPGSPPAAARIDATPDHSPIKPHSGRSPTPLIVDQLLSDMMEDAFTPR